MNRLLDSNTQPSGSPVPLVNVVDRFPPMQTEEEFFRNWNEWESPVAPLSPASEHRRENLAVCEYLEQFDQEAINKLLELPCEEFKALSGDEIRRRVHKKISTPQVQVGPAPIVSPQDPHTGSPQTIHSNSTVSDPLETQMEDSEVLPPHQIGAGRIKKITFKDGKTFESFGKAYLQKEIIPTEKNK